MTQPEKCAHRYQCLDKYGTLSSFWQVLTTTGTIQEAYDLLLSEYDVEPDDLRQDISGLLDKLIDHGLVEIIPAD